MRKGLHGQLKAERNFGEDTTRDPTKYATFVIFEKVKPWHLSHYANPAPYI